MTSVWFVTPAWQRYELTAVCLDQRRDVIRHLEAEGIEGRCVVVADDENLDLARARGFDTVERDNEWLGRRFNDGMEYAGKHGADWIVPIGSDSWIDPAYFLPLPNRRRARTSPLYAPVTADRLGEIAVATAAGAGPYVFHRSLLAASGFRPAKDTLRSRIDTSTIRGLRGEVRWDARNLHPFQYVGFRGVPTITPYARLMRRWGVREHAEPWAILARHYPPELVARAESALAAGLP